MLFVARAAGAAARIAPPALVASLRATSQPLRLALVGATAAASSRAACDDEPLGQSLNEDDSAFLLDAAQTQQALAAHIAQLRRRGPCLGATVVEAHPAPHWSASVARFASRSKASKDAASGADASTVDDYGWMEEGETPYYPPLEYVEYSPFDFEDGSRRRRAAAPAPAEPAPAATPPPQMQPQPAAAPTEQIPTEPPAGALGVDRSSGALARAADPVQSARAAAAAAQATVVLPQPEPPVAAPSEDLENAATARAEKDSASRSSTNPGGRREFRRCCKGYGGGICALNAMCELLIARGMPEADAIAVRFPASERARSRSSKTRAPPHAALLGARE